MSFFIFTQGCKGCGEKWESSFGIVGTSQIGSSRKTCPKCGSSEVETVPAVTPQAEPGPAPDKTSQRVSPMAEEQANTSASYNRPHDKSVEYAETGRDVNTTSLAAESCGVQDHDKLQEWKSRTQATYVPNNGTVVELREHATLCLAVPAQASGDAEALMERLDDYHKPSCDSLNQSICSQPDCSEIHERPCNCGLIAAITEARQGDAQRIATMQLNYESAMENMAEMLKAENERTKAAEAERDRVAATLGQVAPTLHRIRTSIVCRIDLPDYDELIAPLLVALSTLSPVSAPVVDEEKGRP